MQTDVAPFYARGLPEPVGVRGRLPRPSPAGPNVISKKEYLCRPPTASTAAPFWAGSPAAELAPPSSAWAGASLLAATSSGASASDPGDVARVGGVTARLDRGHRVCRELYRQNQGYYTKAGLDVSLIAGGPSTSVEPIVVSGKALVGISGPDLTSAAIDNGAR